MKRNIEVLYVEDDDADVDIVRTILKDIGYENFRLTVIEDGEEVLKYLSKEGSYSGVSSPDLVLLDLNLPKIHGTEILRSIKNSIPLRKIPVVIFSTSNIQEEIDSTYELGASGYFTKPNTYDGYRDVLEAICGYWTTNARLPSKPAHLEQAERDYRVGPIR